MTFMMTYLTKGDPAVTILHAQGTPNITPQLIAETNEKYGLNAPIFIQYKIGLFKRYNLNLVRAILQEIQYQNV